MQLGYKLQLCSPLTHQWEQALTFLLPRRNYMVWAVHAPSYLFNLILWPKHIQVKKKNLVKCILNLFMFLTLRNKQISSFIYFLYI
jgi:hypothetical protein